MTISNTQRILSNHNIFDPTYPLEDSPIYVACQTVRRDVNSVIELSRDIVLSDKKNTCQVYTGHHRNGKSTELKRLVTELEKEVVVGCDRLHHSRLLCHEMVRSLRHRILRKMSNKPNRKRYIAISPLNRNGLDWSPPLIRSIFLNR